MSKEFNFKIGADPEFCIVIQNARLHAANAIPHLIESKYAREGRKEMGFEIESAGNIGWDGCNATAEVRPRPSKKPSEIIKNLKILFESITKKTQAFSLLTTSQLETTGGHIHLELEVVPDGRTMERIHNKMSTLFLPVIMGENSINVKKRLRGGYGQITDYRVGQVGVGNKKTYEFRCPTAEWLTTPKIANAVLSYAGVIFHEIINNSQNISTIKKILLNNKEQAKAIQALTVANFVPLITSLHKSIKQAVRTFEMYPTFQEEIEYILNFKQVLRDKEKAKYDIMKGWKLESTKKPNKRELTSQAQLNRRVAQNDLETIEQAVTIKHSNDTNIELFSKALQQRIIAFNWKLKNKYIIFGLRNGIEKTLAINSEMGFLTGKEQIKTLQDYITIEDLFQRLFTRHFPMSIPSKEKEEKIAIGLPYKDRTNNPPKIKEFINLIYDIEKKKYKPTKIKNDEIDKEETGKIAEIMVNEQRNSINTGIQEFIAETQPRVENEDTDDDDNDFEATNEKQITKIII